MGVIRRVDYYFDEPGPQNTESVLEAVKERIEQTGVKVIILASDSGETALKLSESTGQLDTKIIAVSWKKMSPNSSEKLKEKNAQVVEEARTPLSTKDAKIIAYTYYTLGQGFKVAVEIAMIAVDLNLVSSGQEVIAIGGTGSGADTAIVVKASSTKDILGPDIKNRLEVREIITMPRLKKWWD